MGVKHWRLDEGEVQDTTKETRNLACERKREVKLKSKETHIKFEAAEAERRVAI